MWNICGVTPSPLTEQVLSLPERSRTGTVICSGRDCTRGDGAQLTMLWVEFGGVKYKCSALKSSDAKSNNNPKEKHESKLLITKKKQVERKGAR
jgi:hypothetical protein